MAKYDVIVDIDKMVDEVISMYKVEPVDLLNIGHAENEYNFLRRCKPGYVRQATELVDYFKGTDPKSIKVLEIGCFLGVFSIALAKLGFQVTAIDIEEFISCKNLQNKLNKYVIDYASCNLRNYELPFNDEEFDCVIMIDVLEHLNFNPLPVIKEINRVLKANGLFYIALPNIAKRENRLKLLQGESIHNPIEDFFSQLDRKDNVIVGLHWREYTADETAEILERLDFKVIRQKYHGILGKPRINLRGVLIILISYILKIDRIRNIVYSSILERYRGPSLANGHSSFALKRKMFTKEFLFTDATLPGKQPKHLKADPDYGKRVADGVGLDTKEVERLAEMSNEERAEATKEGT